MIAIDAPAIIGWVAAHGVILSLVIARRVLRQVTGI